MKVSIDPNAGFCFGVKKTIERADEELKTREKLYCVGDIVHNQEEINRLKKSGLQIINLSSLEDIPESTVLFRSHGEPPSSYKQAARKGIRIIDGTCPIVLKLQQKVKIAYSEMKKAGGHVVIYGSENHPEVIGLNGYANSEAIILESLEDIKKLNFAKPIRLFAQTTKDKKKYELIIKTIADKIDETNGCSADFKYFNTICSQVANRVPKLINFCKGKDIIIFVSGKKSSNGQYLFNICKSSNPNSYFISSEDELDPAWFLRCETVGISGATSTPHWLMENIAEYIKTY